MVNYSIIIPHYNIPDLLMRCLHSIPVRSDVQVIVVDDCSPGAEKYLEQYPELSRPCLEFYSTPKGGSAGRARNVGLDHAKGKWLIFADADDFFVEDIDSILDEYVNAEDEVIFFNFECVMSDDITKTAYSKALNFKSYFTDNNTNESLFRCKLPMPWSKFIKTALVVQNNFRFDETHWSNDYFFSVNVGVKAKTIKICGETMYYNTERDGSLSQDFCQTREELITRADVAFRVQEVIESSQYSLPRTIIADDLLRLFFRDKALFKHYFAKIQGMGLKPLNVLSQMCTPCGIKDTFRVWTYVLTHCLI